MIATTAAVVRRCLISVRKGCAWTVQLNAGNTHDGVTKDGSVRHQRVDGRGAVLECPGVENLLVDDQSQAGDADSSHNIDVLTDYLECIDALKENFLLKGGNFLGDHAAFLRSMWSWQWITQSVKYSSTSWSLRKAFVRSSLALM